MHLVDRKVTKVRNLNGVAAQGSPDHDCRKFFRVCFLLPRSAEARRPKFRSFRLDTADSTCVPCMEAVECNTVQAAYLLAHLQRDRM